MTAVVVLLLLGPVLFNAVELWPELGVAVPNLNDGVHHLLFIQRASEALANGQNPFDHWVSEVELGFPELFYYQHLPYFAVIVAHRLLLGQVDLFTLFNLVRYLLLVGFPLTVYWSMRQLGLTPLASAVAAAASSLFASNKGWGIEYNSYVWRGHGMFTQLWAVHLSLLFLACLNRLLERGKGYVSAVLVCSALALSHLVYTYMMVPAVLVLAVAGLNRGNARPRLIRLAVVGALTAVISAYLSVPFVLLKAYMQASPYLERWRYDSFGAVPVLTWLVNGEMLDFGRLPVLTLLLALGIAAAIMARTRPALVALGLFALWLALYFGRPTWGRFMDLLPMHEGLPLHRLVGAVHLGALPLIGLGGEWIWRQLTPLPTGRRALVTVLVLAAILFPAARDRRHYYADNTAWMLAARRSLETDADARTIRSALKELPPGRTYAGLRTGWGGEMFFGMLHFYNLLTFDRIIAVAPPYSSVSLNSDLMWHFQDDNPSHFDLFNVRYVVAPSNRLAPGFLRPIKRTAKYVLYEIQTGGYAAFVGLQQRRHVSSQTALFYQNRSWFQGPDLPAGKFVRYDFPASDDRVEALDGARPPSGCPSGGKIEERRIAPGLFDLHVDCAEAATLLVKETYHPNWRVTVDGRPAPIFMVSPSFIGLELPAGAHDVRAEYRSPAYKTVLLVLGAGTLVAVVFFRRQFDRLEQLVAGKAAPPMQDAT